MFARVRPYGGPLPVGGDGDGPAHSLRFPDQRFTSAASSLLRLGPLSGGRRCSSAALALHDVL